MALLRSARRVLIGWMRAGDDVQPSARTQDRAVTGEPHTLVPEAPELERLFAGEPVRPAVEEHRDALVELVAHARSDVRAETRVFE